MHVVLECGNTAKKLQESIQADHAYRTSDSITAINDTVRDDRIIIQTIHASHTGNTIIAMDDTIMDYILSLNMHQVRSQLALRSLPRKSRSDLDSRSILACDYQEDINDGWWLDPDRHMLLKHANQNAGVTQETLSVVGRRLGYIIPVDEHYAYKLGFSGSEDLPLLLRPDHMHVDNSLGMDVEIRDILADTENNHIGGPLIRSARTLYCRPYGGNARLVFGLQFEGMHKMGLVYCQLGRDVQGPELRLSGDVALYPRIFLDWLDENTHGDFDRRLWRRGPPQEEFESLRRGRLQ